LSSSVGLPSFHFTEDSSGDKFSLPPGLFTDFGDWPRWFKAVPSSEAYHVGKFTILAGQEVHLLSGDLREMIARARRYCARSLEVWLEPEHAATMAKYRRVVDFGTRFLKGGTYRVRVHAYGWSNEIKFKVEPAVQIDLLGPGL
jgi:hypothetical protein